MSGGCLRLVAALAVSMVVGLPVAGAVGFPGAIDYVLQMRSMVEQQSNPGQLSDASDERKSTVVLVNSIGAAARIPLLSEDTRLDLAGSIGDVRYGSAHPLDHQPKALSAALHWKAGDLFAGRLDYRYDSSLPESQNRTWPDRDMRTQRMLQAEAGLRVTEDLTLPILTVFQDRVRYEQEFNQTLYDRNNEGWQVAGRYAGSELNYVQAGFRHTRSHYLHRTPAQVAELDKRFTDEEVFLEGLWNYSTKTSLDARIGYLQRKYDNLSGRNKNFATFSLQGIWKYSPKTRLELRLWQQPYANDDNPEILYARQTSGRVRAVWRPTVKTSLGMVVEHGVRRNEMVNGSGTTTHILKYGPQLTWQANDSMRWILDFYRNQERGPDAFSSYSQNFVRLGVEFVLDNGNPGMAWALQPSTCTFNYVALSMC